MQIQVASEIEADRLWRRMPALRHALGPDFEFEVVGPDGHVLEGFTDPPAERLRALHRWLTLRLAQTAPPSAPGS